ncbi:hypothetical protein EJB05_06678, partial [Eragrostis curvula]
MSNWLNRTQARAARRPVLSISLSHFHIPPSPTPPNPCSAAAGVQGPTSMSALELMDDIVGEVLLRFPPEEPELLVRAALVSKRWCRLIADPGFRRRFREYHRTPPRLGFFCVDKLVPRFVPTSSVRLPHDSRISWRAIDARHGRVLLHCSHMGHEFSLNQLVVWNPITDEQQELPKPPIPPEHVYPYYCRWTAAVLCDPAVGGCNKLDCHRDSFLVVFVCTGSRETFTCIYSSDSGAWSGPTTVQLRHACVRLGPSVLVGNSLYYLSDNCQWSDKVLKVDLCTREASHVRLPRTPYRRIELMDGNGEWWAWIRRRARVQTPPLSIGTLPEAIDVLHFVDGFDVLFVGTRDAFFMINLKSCRTMKLYGRRCIHAVVPYMSSYVPDRPVQEEQEWVLQSHEKSQVANARYGVEQLTRYFLRRQAPCHGQMHDIVILSRDHKASTIHESLKC